jgi:hypothetical protein
MSNRLEQEYSRPLLDSGRHGGETLFSVGDDDEYEHSALQERVGSSEHVDTATFAPPLRSTLQSREARESLSSSNTCADI